MLQLIESYFGFNHSMVLLLDKTGKYLDVAASNGYDETGVGARVEVGVGVIGVVAKNKKMLRMGAVNNARRFVNSSIAYSEGAETERETIPLPGLQNPQSTIGIPMMVKDSLFGVLYLEDEDFYMFKENDEALMHILANQAATALSNARLFESVKKRKEEVGEMNERLSRLNTEQEKTLQLFMKYVPEPVVKKALSSKEESMFDGEKIDIAVLFCDIRDFTPISEKLKPEQVVYLLNSYYSKMTNVIKDYEGSVNQYVGDEIFCTFGAPIPMENSAEQAVKCAVDMMLALGDLNVQLQSELGVTIKVGIGINYGPVVAGNVGSEEKISYAVTGDTVNTGKRIESLTKEQPNSIYIGESIYEQVSHMVETSDLGKVDVKGKAEKINVYRISTLSESANDNP